MKTVFFDSGVTAIKEKPILIWTGQTLHLPCEQMRGCSYPMPQTVPLSLLLPLEAPDAHLMIVNAGHVHLRGCDLVAEKGELLVDFCEVGSRSLEIARQQLLRLLEAKLHHDIGSEPEVDGLHLLQLGLGKDIGSELEVGDVLFVVVSLVFEELEHI